MVTGFRRLGGDFLRSIQSSDTLSSRAFGVLVLPPPPVLRRELEPPAPSGIPSITGCDMLRVAFVLLVQKYIVVLLHMRILAQRGSESLLMAAGFESKDKSGL